MYTDGLVEAMDSEEVEFEMSGLEKSNHRKSYAIQSSA